MYNLEALSTHSVQGRVWVETALFTPVIQVARVRLQSISSLFLVVSQVAIPATCSMTPAA